MSNKPMSVNRISKFYEKSDEGAMVFFERFDHRIIQRVVQKSSEEDEEDDDQVKKTILSQENQLLKTLNLWICHSKKRITTSVFENLLKIDGIETLDAMTRYRFRFAIGKLFDQDEVKAKIKTLLSK